MLLLAHFLSLGFQFFRGGFAFFGACVYFERQEFDCPTGLMKLIQNSMFLFVKIIDSCTTEIKMRFSTPLPRSCKFFLRSIFVSPRGEMQRRSLFPPMSSRGLPLWDGWTGGDDGVTGGGEHGLGVRQARPPAAGAHDRPCRAGAGR